MSSEIQPNSDEPTHLEGIIGARKARNIIILLAMSVGLMMTGYGIIVPVMAKRVGEIGGGVETLGFMTMAFAVGQFLLAPVLGSLADRFGRKPLVLVALFGEIVANLAFLLADSIGLYIGIRLFQGAISAGLLPASMGIVGDIFPENKRGQWIGILMGSYSIGFIFGPALGGFVYDALGFAAPFTISAGLSALAFLFAIVLVPETNPAKARQARRARSETGTQKSAASKSLPRPLYIFATLLTLDFLALFLFAFIEPELAFYLYNDLKFSTSQFGLIVSCYGLAMVIGQVTLGRLGDRFGRKPVIVAGFLISSSFYVSLALLTDFWLLIISALLAGLGSALVVPALSAYYLDITSEQHRSRVMGLKESAAALGGAAGPFLVAFVSGWTSPQQVFLISAVLGGVATVLALVILKTQRPSQPDASAPIIEEAAKGELVKL